MDPPPQHPSAFPTELPPRHRPSFRDRNCSSARSCFAFSLHAYSLRTRARPVLLRRLCMWLTILTRLVLSILNILTGGYGGSWVASVVVGTILGLIGLVSVWWCLATIGEAEGTRRAFGLRFSRMFFDIFLGVYTTLTVVFLITLFFGLFGRPSAVLWNIMWLVIIPVSWAATKPAESPAGAGHV
ncbi:hypothetical protein LTR53_010111 [Teratosphaeriaceae sp. CCFEE 6253]|nr:hypothetical protein LTR53_010111 [Teratosphaeriaceae sp. CCFEE 6253]